MVYVRVGRSPVSVTRSCGPRCEHISQRSNTSAVVAIMLPNTHGNVFGRSDESGCHVAGFNDYRFAVLHGLVKPFRAVESLLG